MTEAEKFPDESDRASAIEAAWNDAAIENARYHQPMNPCLGQKVCITCGEQNDRPSRTHGWDTCIDCRENPGWHLVEDGV